MGIYNYGMVLRAFHQQYPFLVLPWRMRGLKSRILNNACSVPRCALDKVYLIRCPFSARHLLCQLLILHELHLELMGTISNF